MADAGTLEMAGFTLGTPVLVCRWRLAGGTLPLANRHMRALRARRLGAERVSTELVAWAKQNVEWSLAAGAAEHPDGVLMLIVDDAGQAAMTAGPYEPLPSSNRRLLATRALDAAREAEETDVAPEVLVVAHDGALVADMLPGQRDSGAMSLVGDLAKTLGISLRREEGLALAVVAGEARAGQYLLVSDEHGIVAAEGAADPLAERLVGGYQTLLERSRKGMRR